MALRLPLNLNIAVLFFCWCLSCMNLHAQQLPDQNAWLIESRPFIPVDVSPLARQQKTNSDWWTGFPFTINYSRLNNDDRHVIYMLNSRLPYTGKNDLRSATVAFNRVIDESGTEYMFYPTSQIMVDTVYLWVGHENNSNKNDTFMIDVLHTDSLTGYPTEEYLNHRAIITDRSITNPTVNDWRFGAAVIKIHAGNLVGKNRKFAVRVRYYGSFLDTFGIVAGFKNEGACSNPNLNSPSVSTRVSNYYPNTYRFLSDLGAQYPDPNGLDLFRDCNNNLVIDTLQNEWHLQQNLNLWVSLRYDSLSVVPNPLESLSEPGNMSVYPNPSSGNIHIESHLFESTAHGLRILDLQGKEVYYQGFEPQSQIQLDLDLRHLPKGVYFLEMETSAGSVNSRMLLR